jgi:hypothetical protein
MLLQLVDHQRPAGLWVRRSSAWSDGEWTVAAAGLSEFLCVRLVEPSSIRDGG